MVEEPIKPREALLSITQPDDPHWAAYILEITDPNQVIEIKEPAEEGNATKFSLDRLHPGTPYRVRVRPVKDMDELPIWIHELTFDTPGESHTYPRNKMRLPNFSRIQSRITPFGQSKTVLEIRQSQSPS